MNNSIYNQTSYTDAIINRLNKNLPIPSYYWTQSANEGQIVTDNQLSPKDFITFISHQL